MIRLKNLPAIAICWSIWIWVLFHAVAHQHAWGENWPQWRGPDFNGVSQETGVSTEWGPDSNIAWRLPLPGPAGASPIVWEDHIFLTTVDGDQLKLLCVSDNGDMMWERTVDTGNRDSRRDEGNSASPTPATDGAHVVVLMGTGELACYDFAGKKKWTLNLNDRYGRIDIQWGYSASPVLDRGRVYVQIIHGDGNADTHESRVVCLDKRDGSEIWSAPRVTGARAECEQAYCSPLLYRHGDSEFLLTHGADFAVAYGLDDGRELWRLGGLNPSGNYHRTLRFVSSPTFTRDLIVVPTAKGGPVVAISPNGAGDITNTEAVLWRYPRNTPDVPSPLVYDDIVYLCRENGNLLCLDAETGTEIYEQRTVRDRHRASPIYVDGNVYLTARNGTITVVKAGRDFEIVAQNSLNEDMSASPVVSAGTIYLRTFEALYAVRNETGG